MSNTNYTPKSKVGKWFNDRLPLLTLANHLTDYPTPKIEMNSCLETTICLITH